MQQPLGLILLFLLAGSTLVAFFQVVGALFTRTVESSRDALERMPGRAVLLGLVNTIFLGILLAVFIALGQSTRFPLFYLPAVLVAALVFILWAFGLTAISQTLGERLFAERRPFVRNAWGGVVLLLACLTPYIGWFGLTLYASLLGIGGVLIGLFQRARSKPAVTVEEPEKKAPKKK